jgi:hypothetical protein
LESLQRCPFAESHDIQSDGYTPNVLVGGEMSLVKVIIILMFTIIMGLTWFIWGRKKQ